MTELKCVFGYGPVCAPVYDDRDGHVHVWKYGRVLGLEWEQNPLRKTVDKRIRADPNKKYCSLCHCREPPVFKMRPCNPPPDETWIDRYNQGLLAKLVVKDPVDDVLATDIQRLNIIKDPEIFAHAHEYFDQYIQCVQAGKIDIAYSLALKCQSLCPQNKAYKNNVSSTSLWINEENPELMIQHLSLHTNYRNLWKPIKNPYGIPVRFSMEEKMLRAQTRAEIMKPISAEAVRRDKTRRRKMKPGISELRHPMLRQHKSHNNYITMKKNVL